MAIARLGLTALDCDNPDALAAFYSGVTGQEIIVPSWLDVDREGRRWLELDAGGGPTLAFQHIDDYTPPTWPGGERPAQAHIDFHVDDLDATEDLVLALGATKAAKQADPEVFRVFLDPAGHPFCLVLGDQPSAAERR